MFNHHDISRNAFMLRGPLSHHGYDWWWHSFTAQDAETGEDKPFFIEFFTCNPALAEDEPVFGQLPENREAGRLPSYLMVKAGTWGEDHCQLHRFFAWKDVSLHEDAPIAWPAKPNSGAASGSHRNRPRRIRNGCATPGKCPGIWPLTSRLHSMWGMEPANRSATQKPLPCTGTRRE